MSKRARDEDDELELEAGELDALLADAAVDLRSRWHLPKRRCTALASPSLWGPDEPPAGLPAEMWLREIVGKHLEPAYRYFTRGQLRLTCRWFAAHLARPVSHPSVYQTTMEFQSLVTAGCGLSIPISMLKSIHSTQRAGLAYWCLAHDHMDTYAQIMAIQEQESYVRRQFHFPSDFSWSALHSATTDEEALAVLAKNPLILRPSPTSWRHVLRYCRRLWRRSFYGVANALLDSIIAWSTGQWVSYSPMQAASLVRHLCLFVQNNRFIPAAWKILSNMDAYATRKQWTSRLLTKRLAVLHGALLYARAKGR